MYETHNKSWECCTPFSDFQCYTRMISWFEAFMVTVVDEVSLGNWLCENGVSSERFLLYVGFKMCTQTTNRQVIHHHIKTLVIKSQSVSEKLDTNSIFTPLNTWENFTASHKTCILPCTILSSLILDILIMHTEKTVKIIWKNN